MANRGGDGEGHDHGGRGHVSAHGFGRDLDFADLLAEYRANGRRMDELRAVIASDDADGLDDQDTSGNSTDASNADSDSGHAETTNYD